MNRHLRRDQTPPFGNNPKHVMTDRSSGFPDNSYSPLNTLEEAAHSYQPHSGRQSQTVSSNDSNHHRTQLANRTSLREPAHYSAGVAPKSDPPFKILCVTNINNKIRDETVKDALTSDFSRFGDISVTICHDNGERLAYVYFRNYKEACDARRAKSRTLFFDKLIEVEPIYEPPVPRSPCSPYSSPPHDHHRSTHQSHPSYNYPSPPFYGSYRGAPEHYPHPRIEQERYMTETGYQRSPHYDPYHSNDSRYMPHTRASMYPYGAYAGVAHPNRSPTFHQQVSSANRRSPPLPNYRHLPEPPTRFSNREFRRERFGSETAKTELDDGRPSRVLLVNNIDSTQVESDLRGVFEPFGVIDEMELRQVTPGLSSALIKFSSMDAAYRAKIANNGRHIGNLRCRIVYGKFSASRRLWLGGLSSTTTSAGLGADCGKFGEILDLDYSSGRPYAYVVYKSANQAQFAAYHLAATLTPAADRKIRIEFVDPERSELIASRTADANSYQNGQDRRPRLQTVKIEHSNGGERSSVSPQPVGAKRRSITPVDSSKRQAFETSVPVRERVASESQTNQVRSDTTLLSSTKVLRQQQQQIENSIALDQHREHVEELDNSDRSLEASERTGNSFELGRRFTKSSPAERICSESDPEQVSKCISIRDIVQSSSACWNNDLALRNFIFPSKLFLCSGQAEVVDKYLTFKSDSTGDSSGKTPVLSITQRWRLHPQPKLEEVKRRMRTGNLGTLIITPQSKSNQSHVEPPSGCNSLAGQSAQQRHSTKDEQMAPDSIVVPATTVNTSSSSDNTFDDHDEKSDAREQNVNLNGTESDVGNESAQPDAGACGQMATDSNSAGESSSANLNVNPNPVAASSSLSSSLQQSQSRPLRNLISYLQQKDAAGVISLVDNCATSHTFPDGCGTKLLYVFTPGEFALNLIKQEVPNLTAEVSSDEFLLGVLVSGGNEPKSCGSL